MFEQPLFACYAATIAAEFAIAIDYAVTGDHDRELVGSIRLGNGATGRWFSNGDGDFGIGTRFAYRDFL